MVDIAINNTKINWYTAAGREIIAVLCIKQIGITQVFCSNYAITCKNLVIKIQETVVANVVELLTYTFLQNVFTENIMNNRRKCKTRASNNSLQK